MAASKVYFTDMHAKNGDNLLQKLERLMKKAGFEEIDFEGKYVAIKLHFGEPGNLAFLRPNYAKVIVDLVKEHDDAVVEQAGENVIRALAAVGLLHNIGNKTHN